MRYKYLLCPGHVISPEDGQRHYIHEFQLAQLYGVNLSECRVYKPEPWWTTGIFLMEELQNKGLIKLRPMSNGNYKLPRGIE